MHKRGTECLYKPLGTSKMLIFYLENEFLGGRVTTNIYSDQHMINKDIYSIINRLIGLRVGYGADQDQQFLHWCRSK